MILGVDDIENLHSLHAHGSYQNIQSDWTKLNESEASESHHPKVEDLIQRNIKIIELYLMDVIKSRYYEEHEEMEIGMSKDKDHCLDSKERNILIPTKAKKELFDYVSSIARWYRSVLYHNFEHASHVVFSSHLLIQLSRCTLEPEYCTDINTNLKIDVSSFSMANLALVISALVHDVDHQGVGNNQLVEEKNYLSLKYNEKSVAENNSIDIALNLLKESRFKCLRECMFGSSDTVNPTKDAKIFESLLRDMILSTDINSKECIERNKKKWEMALKEDATDAQYHHISSCSVVKQRISSQISYLQLSSVLEQMIQAADVAPLMQSWSVFLKWGRKLFHELWAANVAGRGPSAPVNWFQCQLDFFDFYIFGLVRRLEECGIFGSCASVFLENASNNRDRWVKEGERICTEIYAEISDQYDFVQ
jgi:hypothetical protein